MSDPVVLLSTGDVVGPAGGVTNNSMVLFNGTSGKLIKGNNAEVTAAGLALLDDVNAAAQRVTLGLGNVDNTSDVNKPISTATQTALNLKAPLASPPLTGVPTAPTAPPGTNTTQLATTAFVEEKATAATPPATVGSFARITAPTGWLKANGAAVNRTTYAALFAAIGTTFGAGNDSTTFNLPDLRGEFVRGWDDGRGIDSGRVFGSAQTDEFEKHRHPQYEYDSGNSVPIPDGSFAYDLNANITVGYERTALIGYAGGTETRPRNIALLYCIKY